MAYSGDEQLKRLLEENGIDRPVGEVRDLVAGIAAAPPLPPSRWLPLTGASEGSALASELMALEGELRDGYAYSARDAGRVAALRAELKRREVDGFIITRADEHQGEYVPPRAERLEWLTGFTGSAGLAIVLADQAALFVDGRYTLQAREQVDTTIFEQRHLVDEPAEEWLAKVLKKGQRLAYDPWLHTIGGAKRLREACEKAGAELVPTENLLDAVWENQPPPPIAPVVIHPMEFAGKDADDKRHELGDQLLEARVDGAVLTLPDSIAWLLNVRGADVPRTPLPLSFAVLNSDGTVDLFMDRRKLAPGTAEHLGEEVRIHAPGAIGALLDDLGSAGLHVRLDPGTAADWLRQRLEQAGATVVEGPDPCALPKAKKNPVELQGSRSAHRRDGVALTRFLAWIDEVGATGITEMQAAERLRALREESGELQDLSFDTISGAGPNGAIVHYRVTEASDRTLREGELYLVDSGGQYLDGTTDVTRTVAIGEPTDEMRDRFTRVLKGHIALATASFARKTTGGQLDALARLPLWQAGLDYDHGTGHGVGSYLSVHEGPQSISKRLNHTAIEPGMILSNEPGYYKEGAYGIRIENLVTVVEREIEGGERAMLGFETLTLAPIDRRLVDPLLLSAGEREWLNQYHHTVRETLLPLVDGKTATWLDAATAPLSA